MSGEDDIVQAVLARLAALDAALTEDLDALEGLPASPQAIAEMTPARRVASRALLKTVEQLEDQLARLFRLIPKLLLVDTSRWYAQDHANYAEKLGIIEDAFAWTQIIKLRNRLVHDYPLDPAAQFALLTEAFHAVVPLRSAVEAARAYVAREGLTDD
ncbi:MAG: hypothetical protein V4537_15005 [Pseudomonadota bacterium]